MSGKKPASRAGKRSSNRPARGKLRRFLDIENIMVEEPFTLFKPRGTSGGDAEEDRVAGDGCYVSGTVQNRRYYGLLVDQEALRNASMLWFEDEAGSLDLNRRMKLLKSKQQTKSSSEDDNHQEQLTNGTNTTNNDNGESSDNHQKRPATSLVKQEEEPQSKRVKLEDGAAPAGDSIVPTNAAPDVAAPDAAVPAGSAVPDTVPSELTSSAGRLGSDNGETLQQQPQRQVQKFRYVDPQQQFNDKDFGYRVLLATYADIEAASEDNSRKALQIQQVCEEGGGFVGKYYYQYEALRNALKTAIDPDQTADFIRTSMGFDSFLHGTQLPEWFPLSNLHIGQHKVLTLMNMKKDHNGNVIWDAEAASQAASFKTHVPFESRNHFRVGVMGGGIAGLACCLELLRSFGSQGIDVEVILLEGRNRLGGRLLTDKKTFTCSDGTTPFPVDLGAGWIHGIDHNPLATLAREAGATFVTASEEVKMMHSRQREVDKEVDDAMGKLFDDLLDLGADDCWGSSEGSENGARNQVAVRWYSAGLGGDPGDASKVDDPEVSGNKGGKKCSSSQLKKTDAPSHRHSSDMSIDFAIGKAIAKHKFSEFSKLTKDEHSMLEWNMKNVEFALGANISDLSMKFWDSDERHAFEGDHVLLKEGYSTIVDHVVDQLEKFEEKFKTVTDFPIGKVEYARKTTAQKYPDRAGRKLVELSDTCSVSTEDGQKTMKFDFLVCTLPLGVLKHSVTETKTEKKVVFEPPLPPSKCDSINTVGFGLLDKLFLQFETPFWREPLGLEGDKYLFGNSSGVNPHHYMFTDFGLTLGSKNDAPPVLMTLISGKEAVKCEMLSEAEMVQEALETLSAILSPMVVPKPTAVRRTRWGSDKFSRGCYTFLPPGATDQDFNSLQSPVNGNGDSLVLEGSETMRLFFAGEHTTALHPSMAHGAMLSGIRAAKEIVSSTSFTFRNDKQTDRTLPIAIFRHDNPNIPLQCALCHEMGSRVREGPLLALKRGARQALVHNNCAEFSPEVEVYEGQWRNVIKAVNRGKTFNCSLCDRTGATIGCTHPNCYRVFHFSCSEDTGWRFERDGKVYYCDLHRKLPEGDEADRVSLKFYKSKMSHPVMRCFLCGGNDGYGDAGKLMAFQRRNKRLLVHERCARYTTIVDTKEDDEGRMGIEFANIFEALDKARTCAKCTRHGASIGCANCDLVYHYPCALETGWKSKRRGARFLCESHQKSHAAGEKQNGGQRSGTFQHALFSGFSGGNASLSLPSNSEIGRANLDKAESFEEIYISDDSDSEGSVISNGGSFKKTSRDLKLTAKPQIPEGLGEVQQARLTRPDAQAPWKLNLLAKRDAATEKYFLCINNRKQDNTLPDVENGRIIKAFNNIDVGTGSLKTFKEVLSFLNTSVDILMQTYPKPEALLVVAPEKVESKSTEGSNSGAPSLL